MESADDLTPCHWAILEFLVQGAFFVLSLLGLKVFMQSKGIVNTLARSIDPTRIRAFSQLIKDFKSAPDGLSKAKSLFQIMSGFSKVGGFNAVLEALRETMSAWQWVFTGVVAVAQVTAWFATGGTAFVAKAALSIMSAFELGLAADKVFDECF